LAVGFQPVYPKIHQIEKLKFLSTTSIFLLFSFCFCAGKTEKSKFLDLVDFGDVTFSVETVVEEEATNIQ